jgi:hypothetical protein
MRNSHERLVDMDEKTLVADRILNREIPNHYSF